MSCATRALSVLVLGLFLAHCGDFSSKKADAETRKNAGTYKGCYMKKSSALIYNGHALQGDMCFNANDHFKVDNGWCNDLKGDLIDACPTANITFKCDEKQRGETWFYQGWTTNPCG